MEHAQTVDDGTTNVLLDRLREIVGAANVMTDPATLSVFNTDWTESYVSQSLAVVRPADTGEVSAIVRLCKESGISITPQGGRTGLAGGGVPTKGSVSIILSLVRMNSVRSLCVQSRTVIVESGVVLEALQNYALQQGLVFPLTFGAKGSCTVGGNLATNAGGSNVVRYGNTRELCLGIEAVMPDGSIFDGLSSLRKDNTGYDLKDLLIGSEGTLGVITAAVFKLFPEPVVRSTAFLSLASPEAAIRALNIVQDRTGGSVEAFEYLPQAVVDAICTGFPDIRPPLEGEVFTGVLLEVSSCRESDLEIGESGFSKLEDELLAVLEQLMESGDVLDAVIAQSLKQRNDFWHLRESVLESIMKYGSSYHFDLSLSLQNVPKFLVEMDAIVQAMGFHTLTIGHLGDGNLHYALAHPDREVWASLPLEEAKQAVYALLLQLEGSFSAEHGIGQSKLEIMESLKSPTQLALMRAIKQALDPKNIMNPGKLFHLHSEAIVSV